LIYNSIFQQGLTDVLISQNVWLIKRVHELEERLYKLESGAVSNNGIARPHQGQHMGGHSQQHQQLYNSLFSPTGLTLRFIYITGNFGSYFLYPLAGYGNRDRLLE
jgi:hypothetical protein